MARFRGQLDGATINLLIFTRTQICPTFSGNILNWESQLLNEAGSNANINLYVWQSINVRNPPDGMRIAPGAWDRTVQVWEAFSGKTLLTYRGHAGIVYAVAWSPDGKYIASGGGTPDGTVQVWHADTGEQVLLYRGHCIRSQSVHSVTWSPDGTRLASVRLGSGVRVWEAAIMEIPGGN
jgi:WD40 repeat protein